MIKNFLRSECLKEIILNSFKDVISDRDFKLFFEE